MVVVFTILNWVFVLTNTTTMTSFSSSSMLINKSKKHLELFLKNV